MMDFGLNRADFREKSVLMFLGAYIGLVALFALVFNRIAVGGDAGFWGLALLIVLGAIAFLGLRGMDLNQIYRLARSSLVAVGALFVIYIVWFWGIAQQTGVQPAVGQGMGLSQQIMFAIVTASVSVAVLAVLAFGSKFLRSDPSQPEVNP